jgi:adenylate kinase family enzyme
LSLNKIVIWGSVASGKTTLAKQLSHVLRIPNVIHSDEIIFSEHMNLTSKKIAVSSINDRLANACWIVDGNLGEYIARDEIAQRADLIIIFHVPIGFLFRRFIFRDIQDLVYFRNINNFNGKRAIVKYKLKLIKFFFESFIIIRRFNSSFIGYLYSIIQGNNLQKKTLIISSRQKLSEIVDLISQSHKI